MKYIYFLLLPLLSYKSKGGKKLSLTTIEETAILLIFFFSSYVYQVNKNSEKGYQMFLLQHVLISQRIGHISMIRKKSLQKCLVTCRDCLVALAFLIKTFKANECVLPNITIYSSACLKHFTVNPLIPSQRIHSWNFSHMSLMTFSFIT